MQHKNLAKTWYQQPITYQMGNIGSEVSRALANQNNPARFQGAFVRALELFELSIKCAEKQNLQGRAYELRLARAEFCDYFDGNHFGTDPTEMQLYYDQFALLWHAQQMS